MKSFTLSALLAGFSTASLVHADVSVSSEPLGYTTTTLYGSFANGSKKNNIVAPNLVNQAAWRGTIASKSGDVITLTSAAFTPSAFNAASLSPKVYSYFLSTGDGFWSHIISNSATAVTLPAGYAADFDVGENVVIRRHLTIVDFLGHNEVGLKDTPDGDLEAADQVVIIDEVNGGSTIIVASSVVGSTWINDSFESADNYPIYPNQALQITRKTAANLSLKTIGEVDTKGRQLEVKTGLNLRPIPVPVGATLNTLQLYTGNPATGIVGTADGNVANADKVQLNINGTSQIFFYLTQDLGTGIGWHNDSFEPVGNTLVPPGSGLIITRGNNVNNSPFVWVSPAPAIN